MLIIDLPVIPFVFAAFVANFVCSDLVVQEQRFESLRSQAIQLRTMRLQSAMGGSQHFQIWQNSQRQLESHRGTIQVVTTVQYVVWHCSTLTSQSDREKSCPIPVVIASRQLGQLPFFSKNSVKSFFFALARNVIT